MNVREFYSGKCILITGCTGFLGIFSDSLIFILGKVVLEKILRAMPDIRKIYLLTRPKVNLLCYFALERSFCDGKSEKRDLPELSI